MILFQGAIGQAYVSLYSPRIPTKDKYELLTGVKIKNVAKGDNDVDMLKYGEIEYKYSEVALEFNGNRSDVETIRTVKAVIHKPNVSELVRQFEWTESAFGKIENMSDEKYSIKIEPITVDSPYIYKIKFDPRQVAENNNNLDFKVKITASDEKHIMKPELGHAVDYKTKKLLLKVTLPAESKFVEKIKGNFEQQREK